MIVTDISTLRKKADKVKPEEILDIISKLEKDLYESITPGVGLAAPQIGINKSAAIIRYTSNGINEFIDLVNPKILERNNSYLNKNECCLSLPGQSFNTQRHKEIFIVDDLHPAGFVACGFVATIIEHECLTSQSIIYTELGPKTISWVIKTKYNGRVLCVDSSGTTQFKKIIGVSKKMNIENKKWISLKFSKTSPHKSLKCTEDHLCGFIEDILTPTINIKYCQARDMVSKYSVRLSNNKSTRECGLYNSDQMSSIFGCLLGDGCISKTGELVFNHGINFKDYAEFKKDLFCGYITKSFSGFRDEKTNFSIHCPITEQTKKLREISYTPNKKASNIINLINEISLAFWYMDDGCLDRDRASIHTEGFEIEDIKNCVSILFSKFNLDFKIYKKLVNKKDMFYLHLDKKNSERFFNLISKYVHESMKYKLPYRYRFISNNYLFNKIPLDISCKKIKEVFYLKKMESALYNIEVEDCHNFFANNTLVHNCDHLEGILIIDRAVGKLKIGRNDPCPCGKKINGKAVKWKNCHGI